jgi:hypothetical protein
LHIAIRDLKTLAEMLGFFVARLLVVAVDGDHRLQNKIW